MLPVLTLGVTETRDLEFRARFKQQPVVHSRGVSLGGALYEAKKVGRGPPLVSLALAADVLDIFPSRLNDHLWNIERLQLR